MGHKSYEESIKDVYKGLVLLGFVTLVEVGVSLFGKGHLGFKPSPEMGWLIGLVALALIVLSFYKAYFIIYEFMHMSSEARGLRLTVLMPCLLLVWAIIAFFWEGSSWLGNRELIKQKNERSVNDKKIDVQGSLINNEDTYQM